MNERLEKEIETYFDGWMEDDEYGETVKPDCYGCTLLDCKDIAKHFYNLALEDVRKEVEDKKSLTSEIMEAMRHIQADNGIKFSPAVGAYAIECYTYILNFIDELTI